MVQAFFDGHPLEEYLRDSGETPELMPGAIAEFSLQPYLTGQPYFSRHCESMEKLCYSIFGAFEFLVSLFHSDRRSRRTHAFSERFKYGVISSTLLSPAFATASIPYPHRRSLSPSLPGRLTSDHSRNTSASESILADHTSLSIPAEPEIPLWPITVSFTVAIAALSAQFYFLFLVLLAGIMYYIHVHKVDFNPKSDVMTPSLEALQNLISAGQLWDSVINDTFSILENEERSIFYGPTSPRMPSSSLRVALSSSLLTTQTQCDKIRPVLATIASPDELSQLSEMYAPPSPMKSTFSFNNDSRRPSSHPGSRQRANSLTDRMKKRSTWNGTYTALALAGSPLPFQFTQRREKRRSDLSALLSTPPQKSSLSCPTSPSGPNHLPDVSEEDDSMMTAPSSLAEGNEESFGAAALGIQRKRRSGGARTFELSQRSAPASTTSNSPLRRRPTLSSGSKYTSMQPSRHPLSLSALHQSLQCALASKRFACSHLLALRFEEDEEGYWEDVRSVMSLLTSALVDATSRLSEVLDEVEEQHFKVEDSVSESQSGAHTPSSIASPPAPLTQHLSQMMEQTVSFAPMPSQLSRFSAHVDAISSALNDAREHLEQCVSSLKQDFSPGHSPHPSTSSAGDASDHPAIQAYERLRRELGFALRECERGRERLVNIVTPPTPLNEDIDEDVLPALGPDGGTGEAEKPDEPLLPPVDLCLSDGDVSLTVVSPDGETLDVDDASSHLLLTATSLHLPPPGVEQVFEADTGTVGVFTRERSKLNREERIKLAKARRERGAIPTFEPNSSSSPPPPLKMERWGPGGEVVQELKDVIWKVGERRRKTTESHFRSVVSNASSSIPPSPHGSMTPVNILPEGTAS
ncbi:hypothetical protein F5I97DRAFT_1947094 [Phlebopus sp. FC_14]|nr:hypothetical protein F5I97DRAFT_1947094 [Phlebopus sp. FC_14]